VSRRTLSLLAISVLSLTACGGTTEPPAASLPGESVATQAPANIEADSKVAEPKTDALAETSMDDVETKLASGDCHVFDANSESTRTAQGIIEGAVLLDSYREYDLASLPGAKDAQVVFYCGSTMCTASDKAANRALEAGYSNVSVMREGIKGWKKAGKKTVEWTAPTTEKTEG